MAFNPLNPEWPKQAADLIDRVAQAVRRNVTDRAVKATNALVFGLLAAFTGLVALVLSLIIAMRSIEAYLIWDPGTLGSWIIGVIALVGVVSVLGGLIRSKKLLMLAGGATVAIAGARWAIAAGDASIDENTAVWISYLVVGGLFVVVGAFLMAKRQTPAES
jgi:hypothetical protein